MKMDKGPQEVMRALFSGNEEKLKEALTFQRESFKAKYGCYPDELIPVRYEVKLVQADHFGVQKATAPHLTFIRKKPNNEKGSSNHDGIDACILW